MRAVYRRVLSLTIMAKLVQKYAKKPEDFMNQEKVSVGVKLVPKRKGTGQICYDYREACWNNYDLYCLCSGISRHGFGEWEAILKDEVVWAMHLKSNEPDPTEDDIDEEAIVKEKKQPQETFSMPDILMRKLIPSYAQYSQKGSHALNKYELAYLRSLNELLKRRASNFTNLVYENSSHFKLLDS